jgi:fumarylacetoacetate (FAA) hydrolase
LKLASRRQGRDGALLVVSRDLSSAVDAWHIAATLQAALDDWQRTAPQLAALYERLNAGTAPGAFPLDFATLDAPLPRAWQWLDGSAFPQHAVLMAQAFNRPRIEHEFPLMYQGMSHRFLGGHDAVPFVDEADHIDFEGEFAVITGAVPLGADRQMAADSIRLVMQLNDWSLRRFAALEVKTGFGWLLAKPACSAAPVVVTPDELGHAWRGQRLRATLQVWRGDEVFGRVPADEMACGFDELIVHAARTRELCAGTIVGSGTVSSSRHATVGSCCISERQAIETIRFGAPSTPYLRFGETVRMAAFAGNGNAPLFGTMQNTVAAATRRG